MSVAKMQAEAVKRAKERAGAGWALLGADLREALVAREALAIISHNEDNPGFEKAAALAALVLRTAA